LRRYIKKYRAFEYQKMVSNFFSFFLLLFILFVFPTLPWQLVSKLFSSFYQMRRSFLQSVLYCRFQTQHFFHDFFSHYWGFLDVVAKKVNCAFVPILSIFIPHGWQIREKVAVTYCSTMWQNDEKKFFEIFLTKFRQVFFFTKFA
jgi:hypothetical protein